MKNNWILTSVLSFSLLSPCVFAGGDGDHKGNGNSPVRELLTQDYIDALLRVLMEPKSVPELEIEYDLVQELFYQIEDVQVEEIDEVPLNLDGTLMKISTNENLETEISSHLDKGLIFVSPHWESPSFTDVERQAIALKHFLKIARNSEEGVEEIAEDFLEYFSNSKNNSPKIASIELGSLETDGVDLKNEYAIPMDLEISALLQTIQFNPDLKTKIKIAETPCTVNENFPSLELSNEKGEAISSEATVAELPEKLRAKLIGVKTEFPSGCSVKLLLEVYSN